MNPHYKPLFGGLFRERSLAPRFPGLALRDPETFGIYI